MQKDEFTLEKLEISKRLAGVESKMDLYLEKMKHHDEKDEEMFKSVRENIDKLNHIIIGNGKPGIAEDVRELRKKEDKRDVHNRIFYGAIVAGFGEWVWRTLGHLIK